MISITPPKVSEITIAQAQHMGLRFMMIKEHHGSLEELADSIKEQEWAIQEAVTNGKPEDDIKATLKRHKILHDISENNKTLSLYHENNRTKYNAANDEENGIQFVSPQPWGCIDDQDEDHQDEDHQDEDNF